MVAEDQLLKALEVFGTDGIDFELFEIKFTKGYEQYNRIGLKVTGQYGEAEVSPLNGYFEDINFCIKGAIDTVSKPWPIEIRSEIGINSMLSNLLDINDIENQTADTLKIKISDREDYEIVAKARDIFGLDVNLRLDCNGIFDVETARIFEKLVRKYSIEFIEQPCATNEECAKVNLLSETPIAIDETARTTEQIKEIELLGAGDIIVLKVQPCGGIHKALELANEWSKDVVVASMMESEVGLNVGIRLAKALPDLNYACGLDSSTIDNVIYKPIYTQF